eukprot:scaffold4722_cov60-Phaeocystis_antarctica.AAC.5
MPKARAVTSAHVFEPTGQRSLASRYRCAASTLCPELESAAPRAIASRKVRAALRQSSLEAYRIPLATSSWYSSPDCAATWANFSAASRCLCCITPPSSIAFRCLFTSLWYTVCRFQASGFPGQLTQHQYVVGTLSLTQIGQTSCLTRSSPISDGSRAQPKQARLIATFDGTPPSSATGSTSALAGAAAAGGGAAAASVASRSAFSVVSASRTSLVPAPRSCCCSRSLASSSLGPRPGSASHSPRTASRRPSAMRRRQRDPHTASSLGRKDETR